MKNLKDEAYKVRMTPEEKAMIRSRLFAVSSSRPSPYFMFHFQFMTRALALALVVMLVGGGGVAYAAQGTLPGDPLYAVKVDVTEPIQTALAVTPEARADVHVELAQRRVEEAEALASQGKLTATTTQQLEQNFNNQTTSASDLALEVGHSDPAAAVEIEAKIASSLSVHGAILAALGEQKSDGDGAASSAFAAHVLARAQAAASSSAASATEVAVASASATGPTVSSASNVRTFATAAPQVSSSASTSVEVSTTSATSASTASTSVAISAPAESPQNEQQTGGKENSELQSRASQALSDAQSSYDSVKSSLDATTTATLDAQFDQAAQYLSTGEYAHALGLALKLEAILSVQQKYRGDIAPLLNLQLNLGSDRRSGNH